jgi:hypothetical protein
MAVSVAVKGAGEAVVYQTSSGVFFDLLDSSLAPAQLDQAVSSSASSWIDATTRDAGGFTVEWLANGSIMAEDFSATGASLGAAHRWTGPTPAQAPLAFASNANGSTAVLPSGGSVTGSVQTVQNQYVLHIQQYDASGHPNASVFTLTAPPVSLYAAPNIAPLADGGYVAAYALDGNYSASLYLERFSSQGAPLGQITVANYGGLVSLQPANYSIAGLPDGGFVAAWSLTNSLSSTSEAYAEEFTASGTGLGVVDLGHAASKAPVIDALGDGRYALAWTSDTGAAEHRTFTEAGASLGKLDSAPPAGSGSGSDPLGGQTWSQALAQAQTTMQHALSSAGSSANSAWHGLAAMLSGALETSTHASASAPVASEPTGAPWSESLEFAHNLHSAHHGPGLHWFA